MDIQLDAELCGGERATADGVRHMCVCVLCVIGLVERLFEMMMPAETAALHFQRARGTDVGSDTLAQRPDMMTATAHTHTLFAAYVRGHRERWKYRYALLMRYLVSVTICS